MLTENAVYCSSSPLATTACPTLLDSSAPGFDPGPSLALPGSPALRYRLLPGRLCLTRLPLASTPVRPWFSLVLQPSIADSCLPDSPALGFDPGPSLALPGPPAHWYRLLIVLYSARLCCSRYSTPACPRLFSALLPPSTDHSASTTLLVSSGTRPRVSPCPSTCVPRRVIHL